MRRPSGEELISINRRIDKLLTVMLQNNNNEYNLESVAACFLEVSYCNSYHLTGKKAESLVAEMVEKAESIWDVVQGTLEDDTLGYNHSSPVYVLMQELYKGARSGRIASLGKYYAKDKISEDKEKDHNDNLKRSYDATKNYILSIIGASQLSRSMNRHNINYRGENPLPLLSSTTMFQMINYYKALDNTEDIGFRENALPVFTECLLAFNNNSISTPIEVKPNEGVFKESYQKTIIGVTK